MTPGLTPAEAFFGSPWIWAIIGVFAVWFGLGYGIVRLREWRQSRRTP